MCLYYVSFRKCHQCHHQSLTLRYIKSSLSHVSTTTDTFWNPNVGKESVSIPPSLSQVYLGTTLNETPLQCIGPEVNLQGCNWMTDSSVKMTESGGMRDRECFSFYTSVWFIIEQTTIECVGVKTLPGPLGALSEIWCWVPNHLMGKHFSSPLVEGGE